MTDDYELLDMVQAVVICPTCDLDTTLTDSTFDEEPNGSTWWDLTYRCPDGHETVVSERAKRSE